MILDKKSILLADDVVKELVSVPEWGGDVWVRGMTGAIEQRVKGGRYKTFVPAQDAAVGQPFFFGCAVLPAPWIGFRIPGMPLGGRGLRGKRWNIGADQREGHKSRGGQAVDELRVVMKRWHRSLVFAQDMQIQYRALSAPFALRSWTDGGPGDGPSTVRLLAVGHSTQMQVYHGTFKERA